MGTIIKKTGIFLVLSALLTTFCLCHERQVCADEMDLFTTSVPPNVLFILDNSNSMDQDFLGNAICSFKTGSRSVEGKSALIGIVNSYIDMMRVGLMTYELPSASKYYLHNCMYFCSYEPKSYCPNPPEGLEEYAKTGNSALLTACEAECLAQNAFFDADYMDEIIPHFSIGSEQRNRYVSLVYPKTHRVPNPADPGNYIYYKVPGTLYSGSNCGTRFAYSEGYNPVEGTTDNYKGYAKKTGTSDGFDDYDDYRFYWGFQPTDEDWALGFGDFGRRLSWIYSGRTWFANNSPGEGFLHVECDDNDGSDSQKNMLLAKLDTKENDESGYMSYTGTSTPNNAPYIINAGLTPTAGTLQSACDYFKGDLGSYDSPIQYWCQKNFIIYVTDGLPSVAEDGSTGTADELMPEVLTKLDDLRSLEYKVGGHTETFDTMTYVVGLGLTEEAKAKLDAMAVHGGTDVDGHAYYADSPEQLRQDLALILQDVIEKIYSFANASVTSSRVTDEDYLYEASFEPKKDNCFWNGHLKKYSINADGSVGTALWDSGVSLQSTNVDIGNGTYRPIYTYKSGALVQFTTSNITKTDLDVSTDAERDAVVGYIHGDAKYNTNDWKLGDIFHCSPITIGTPSCFFADTRDANDAFSTFRTNHQRTSAAGTRIIFSGANDGQLHAFRTSTGEEVWSFIPPNLLPKLQEIAISGSTVHQCFVDGEMSAYDVWLGTGDGTSKYVSDWKSLLVVGLGKGGTSRLWSSSSSCDEGFSDTYSTTYRYYGGVYSFDVTDPSNPTYKWRLDPDLTEAPYLGEPWFKMRMGRVKINGNEKWVGFMGAGYNATDYKLPAKGDLMGKAFFVVDLSNGDILWKYTWSDNSNMIYSIPASPAIVDTDNDGFIDTAYVGDLGGNMWRFKFCRAQDGNSYDTSNWSGGLLFGSSTGTIRPIFTSAAVSKDSSGNLWVYWGTGDKVDPTDANAQEKFYGVKDNDRTTTHSLSDLENITTGTYDSSSSTAPGWYMNLPGQGEKILAEPTVFGGIAYFTTFTPDQTGDPCAYGGGAKLYGLNFVSGDGIFSDSGDRDITIGTGVPTAPVVSIKPGPGLSPDLYVTISSGSGGQGPKTIRANFDPPALANRTNMLFWYDTRLQ